MKGKKEENCDKKKNCMGIDIYHIVDSRDDSQYI